MTDKEKTAAIAFFSNLVDHDAEAWGYESEIPLFKTALEALETPRDWTPCAEGLPEIMKRVIVTICGEIVIAEREHELDDDETTLIHWYDDEGCRFNDDVVTAWMPMPEPWTGGLDGK